jgi:hypothetical protein
MFSLRLFPTFEKPVERARHLNIEPARRNFGGVAAVLVLAASCGVALALWEPSTRSTTPFVTASTPSVAEATKVAAAPQPAGKAVAQETTAAAEVEDDEPALTVKLSSQCTQRATARRDCANVKALKEARLKAPAPVPTPPAKPQTAPAVVAQTEAALAVPPKADPAPAVITAAVVDQAEAAPPKPVKAVEAPAASVPEQPGAKPQRTATQKTKKPRVLEEPPVERLVRVYDQVLPDGRRVPVYRRANGRLEIGGVVEGEYRSYARRAEVYGTRYFGLQ